jgi:hypothetical protein
MVELTEMLRRLTETHVAQIVIVLIGVLVPAAFALFVISITRRGREFEKMDGLFSAIHQLETQLHKAFIANDKGNPE